MNITTLIISIISLLIGIGATAFVSQHYFKRTTEKSLTPFIDYSAHFLENIDPEVKKDLSIKFQENKVDELTQMQFLIANSGERPIRDLIRPLELHIPESATVLDSSILHIYPEGRDVSLHIDDSKRVVCINFQLLNKDEFFVVRLLLNGNIKSSELKFTISADDLPPVLPIQHLPYDMVATEDESKESSFNFGLLAGGVMILLMGLSPVYIAYEIDLSWPFFSLEDLKNIKENLTLLHLAEIFTWLTGLLIAFVGIVMIIFSFSELEIRRKNKFLLPEEISYRNRYSHRVSLTVKEAEVLSPEVNVNDNSTKNS